jgi:hypothetical protein
MGTTQTEIRSGDTNYFAETAARRKLGPVQIGPLTCLLLALPLLAGAQGETTRIEIAHGKRPFVTLSAPEDAGQLTVWSGPGTGLTQSGDIADWAAGTVAAPHNLNVFKVRFFCAADQTPAPVVATSHQCYGVYYGIDPQTRQGFIRIPPADDKQFPDNTRSIYRGVEGSWYRASGRWETLVRPQIEAALASNQPNGYSWYDQQHIYSPPASNTAVSARPALTPKK